MPSSSRHERSRFSGGALVLFGALCLAACLWTAFDRSGPLVPKRLFAVGFLLLAVIPLISPLRGALAVFFLVPFFGNFPGGRWIEILNIPLSAGIVGLLLHARRRKLPPPAGRLWAAALLCVASAALALIPSLEGVAVRLAQINSLPEAVVETLSARETDPLYSLASLLLLALAAAWAYALAWASPGSAFATNALRAVAASFFVVVALGALDLHHRIDLQSVLKRIDERSLSFEGFQSIFWNPGWFSWYFVMAFSLVMGLLWLESRPVRWLLGAGLAVSYVYSFDNPQRGGFLALHATLGVAVLSLLASSVSKRRNLVWVAAVLCVAAVLAVIAFRVLPKPQGRGTALARLTRLTSGLETDSVRKNLAATAVRMWRDSPVFGIGEGSFCWRYGEYVRVGPDTDAAYGDAHSTWLQLLATRGILGLAAFLGLLVALGRRVVYTARVAGPERGIGLGLGFSLIAFLTYSFVQYMFYLQAIQTLFWGITALATIVSPESREERGLSRVARRVFAAVGLGALILQLGLSRAQLARGAARVRLEPRGFYPVEKWGTQGAMRWSSRNGTLCLYPSARTLSLRMLTADPDAGNRSIAVSIRANGRVLDRFDLKDAVVRERSFDLQESDLVQPPEGEWPFGQCVKGARSLHLSVEVSRTWSPFSRGVSGDTRHLGVAVFEPKFSSGAAASRSSSNR